MFRRASHFACVFVVLLALAGCFAQEEPTVRPPATDGNVSKAPNDEAPITTLEPTRVYDADETQLIEYTGNSN